MGLYKATTIIMIVITLMPCALVIFRVFRCSDTRILRTEATGGPKTKLGYRTWTVQEAWFWLKGLIENSMIRDPGTTGGVLWSWDVDSGKWWEYDTVAAFWTKNLRGSGDRNFSGWLVLMGRIQREERTAVVFRFSTPVIVCRIVIIIFGML